MTLNDKSYLVTPLSSTKIKEDFYKRRVIEIEDFKEFIKDLIIKCPQCKLMITKLAGDL